MKVYKNDTVIPPIELCDEDGNVTTTVRVLTDYLSMRNRLNASLGKLQKLQNSDAGDEEIGHAVCELVGSLYGDDGLAVLLKFYDGDYGALVTTVLQHVAEDVAPALERYAKQRVAAAKKLHGGGWFNRR